MWKHLFVICLECISTFFNIYLVYKEKIKKDKWLIIFAVVYVSYFGFLSYLSLPGYIDIISPIAMVLWAKKVFGRKWSETFIRTIVFMVFTALEQSLVMVLFIMVLKSRGMEGFTVGAYIAMILVVLFVSILLYYLIMYKNITMVMKIIVKHRINLIYVVALALVVCLIAFMKSSYTSQMDIYAEVYIICALVLFVAIIIVLGDMKTKKKLYQKQLELELNNKYMKTYEDLILEIRQKQHDYNNQLSALYSMHHVAEDKEQLVKMQREYVDELVDKDTMDKILFQCDNPVICGYIYSKSRKAFRDGIIIDSTLNCGDGDTSIPLHKLIEILGILLDNAVEYLQNDDFKDKRIKLLVERNLDELIVEVKNPSEYYSFQQLDSIFKPGESTKGEKRGLGLSSLKTIAKEYKGQVLVENADEDGINWFKVRVVI